MRCPSCGYDLSRKYSLTDIIELKSKFDKDTIRLLKLLITKMLTRVTESDIGLFLDKVKDCEKEVIENYINIFNNNNLYIDKGLNYLASMILNHEDTIKRHKDVEKRLYGEKPIVRKI